MATEGAPTGAIPHQTADPAPDRALEPAADAGRDRDSDAALMRAVIDGSQVALAGLYDRHSRAVYGAALRTSRDPSVAEEVVQETFLALWNRAEMYDPARGALPSWLLTIARNRAVDHLRSAGRRDRAASFSSFGRDDGSDQALADWLTASGELIGAAGSDPAPESALAGKELRESIDEAIAALDPAERSVILLAYDGGLTQAEIAVRLGWPLGTVKTRTRRALGRLREMLERSGDHVATRSRPAGPASARHAPPPGATARQPAPCPVPCS